MDLIIFLINLVFTVGYLILAVRVLLPWVPHNRDNPAVRAIYQITDPVLNPLRQGLPPLRIGFDVSPFILLLFLYILQRLILYMLGGL